MTSIPGKFVDDAGSTRLEGAFVSDQVSLQSATVSLTNADVIALNTTSFEIVAAPGANIAVVPVHASLVFDRVADYATFAVGSKLYLGNASAQLTTELNEGAVSAKVSDFLAGGDSGIAFLTAIQSQNAVANPQVGWTAGGLFKADVANRPLNLVAVNSGNYTGGDAGNVLTVTVIYYTVTFA